MFRRILVLVSLCVCACTLLAQDLSNIQIHGFASQGFLFSNHNNYFTADTNKGSLQWTDGAISLSDVVSDKLRVGIQIHMRQLGQLGGPTPEIDWATGDYKLNEHLGFRVGKVKTPLGLFNDSQDVDAAFLWALLPESNYPTDNRDYTLAHLGADIYGGYQLGPKAGKLLYRGFIGYRNMDLQSGNIKLLADLLAITFTQAPGGKTFGGDVRWQTPLKGLMIGASENIAALDWKQGTSSFHYEPQGTNVGYVQYERGKLSLAAEYKRRPIASVTILPGSPVRSTRLDRRSGFVMASYRVLPRLQVGSYACREVRAHLSMAVPGNFLNDIAISGRYDINSYFYFKVEEHFERGTEASLFTSTNPAGLKTSAKMTAAKIGFSF
jgi:hypothetical protein